MKEQFRIYYYFVIGALGGLHGWFFSTLFSGVLEQGLLSQVIYGGVFGAIIGISVAAFDGIANRSFRRFIKFGSIGLILGAIAGSLALPLTQIIYETLIGTAAVANPLAKFLVGTLCWILFGGLIGLGEGVGKGTQFWKGLLGGMLGGLVGGLIYETNRTLAGNSTEAGDEFRRIFLVAISLTLLGAMVSAAIAFVAAALKEAWIEVTEGKLAGRIYDVTKYVDPVLGVYKSGIIGSDEWSAHIYLPGDNEILPRHAEINFANGAPTITVSPEASKRQTTVINGRRLMHSSPLSNGDQITVGSTTLIYRNKK